jgi:Zn-dependent oligopeptidase
VVDLSVFGGAGCLLSMPWLPSAQLAKRLFDVTVEPADGQVPVWHPDVRFFSLKKAGQQKAYFYLDPYSRPAEKRGGAWMADVRVEGLGLRV